MCQPVPKLADSPAGFQHAHQLGVRVAPQHDRVHLGLAEAPRERDLRVLGERLAAEEDDRVREEGLADLGEALVRERVGEVHAGDLGAERARDRVDLDVAVAHG